MTSVVSKTLMSSRENERVRKSLYSVLKFVSIRSEDDHQVSCCILFIKNWWEEQGLLRQCFDRRLVMIACASLCRPNTLEKKEEVKIRVSRRQCRLTSERHHEEIRRHFVEATVRLTQKSCV